MKYILLMHGQKSGVDEYMKWPKEAIGRHFAALRNMAKELSDSGEFVGTEGLDIPHRAKVVRAGKNSAPITDGVFPEAKEFLLGYWIVDVESEERAFEIAARISGMPGPDGPLSMPIEVRQIMTHKAESSGE